MGQTIPSRPDVGRHDPFVITFPVRTPTIRLSHAAKGSKMKTMTCRQLGGPCDVQFHGTTADEVIKADDQHLKEAVAAGDLTHTDSRQKMKDRWKNPIGGMGWYLKTRKAFAALPVDQ